MKGVRALHEESVGAASMHALWGHQPDARVAVDGIVPQEEALAVGAGVFDAAELLGKVGTVCECFEL